MDQPNNLTRMWCVRRGLEQCVGAVAEGRVPGVIDNPPPEPFVTMISFAKLGQSVVRSGPNGEKLSVQPVLEAPHDRPTEALPCKDMATALGWLEDRKAELLSDGWHEVSLDPVSDPD